MQMLCCHSGWCHPSCDLNQAKKLIDVCLKEVYITRNMSRTRNNQVWHYWSLCLSTFIRLDENFETFILVYISDFSGYIIVKYLKDGYFIFCTKIFFIYSILLLHHILSTRSNYTLLQQHYIYTKNDVKINFDNML